MNKVKIVAEALCNISLPSLKRPALGADD